MSKDKSEVRLALEKYITDVAVRLKGKVNGPIVELGMANHVYNKVEFQKHHPNNKFIGTDCVSFPHNDMIIDATKMKLPDNSVGLIIAADVWEHVFEVMMALKECYRVLRPDGWLISTTPFNYKLHRDNRKIDIPGLKELGLEKAVELNRLDWVDYFRLTPSWYKKAMRRVGFKYIEIKTSGKVQFPDGVYCLCRKAA